METFFVLLAICAGSSPVRGEFPTQRPVRRSFDVFFDLCLNKRLSKQSWGWWFETLLRPLWRHRNVSQGINELISDWDEAIDNGHASKTYTIPFLVHVHWNGLEKLKYRLNNVALFIFLTFIKSFELKLLQAQEYTQYFDHRKRKLSHSRPGIVTMSNLSSPVAYSVVFTIFRYHRRQKSSHCGKSLLSVYTVSTYTLQSHI